MIKKLLSFINSFIADAKIRALVETIIKDDFTRFESLLANLKDEISFRKAGPTLLGLASSETTDPRYLEELLKTKINPNLQTDNGQYPLHIAVENGRIQMVKVFLNYGTDPNQADENGVTPLHISYSFDQLGDISDLLISSGANPNLRDNIGKRYLM
ncbi:MAG: ankyrin repeat domain-containing protein [Leptospira sp.]|nr:ankyrin repeat domain-containing protein [Leptospira sp.]